MRRLDWLLHTYYEELHKRRRPVSIGNPTGRMVVDGGAVSDEFKSKIPVGIEYTDLGILDVSQRVKKGLLNLEAHNERWYLAVALTYQRLQDGSMRQPKHCCEALNVEPRTYRKHRAKGRWWLKEYFDKLI